MIPQSDEPFGGAVPWVTAWHRALYGADGFFVREAPGDHFRTSVHASPAFAGAVLALARACGLDRVVDLGAGQGELLADLRRVAPDLRLIGVEVASRPENLPSDVEWRSVAAKPPIDAALVVANEWLDNVPCLVAMLDGDGDWREILVDPASMREAWGPSLRDDDVTWCHRWVPDPRPGDRVEIGRSRDEAWCTVVGGLTRGVAVTIDYGPRASGTESRSGGVRAYRSGREVEVALDGSCDVTAPVNWDSVEAAISASKPHGGVTTIRLDQRTALRRLGLSGDRPEPALATTDPVAYLRGLSSRGEVAELTASPGLGDFTWLVTAVGAPMPDLLLR
ncbi:MAG: SAM-dependent methyltransferase [Nocardioidaceae bacterium]